MFVFTLGTMSGQYIFLTSCFLDIVNLHHQISGKKEKKNWLYYYVSESLNLKFSCAIISGLFW